METKEIIVPEKLKRKFVPEDLRIEDWKNIEPYFNELKERAINSVSELEKWMRDRSELEAACQENQAWRYIKMTCDTTNKNAVEAYEHFVANIRPHLIQYSDVLNRKLVTSPFISSLPEEKYRIYIRGIKKELEIFREENIPLFTEEQELAKDYGAITGAMTVTHNGKEITLQQAARLLKDTDRNVRKEIFYKINDRKEKDRNTLDELLNKLIAIRHKVSKNAGFNNFRDFQFENLGRFDYTVKDCFDFHEAIRSEVVPLVKKQDEKRKSRLQLDRLKPWDMDVDISGKPALKPFETGAELTNKTIKCFYNIKPFYGECLEVMKHLNYLDLESRIGKAPGGYNYPLHESGIPFIFMNAVGTFRDLHTMVHEGGHAIHTFLSRNLELTSFKDTPSEVAELASMAMELISMEHWETFFDNQEELVRAKKEQLEQVFATLCWIAAVDKFQHWIYENPTHSTNQRTDYWLKLMSEFKSDVVDWSEDKNILGRLWHSQLHIFEIPFYYIEYGMAQLGAIAVWRNYKNNPEKGLTGYENALKLGYTKSIPEIYEAAGIKFDFSKAYVKELMEFVQAEFNKL